MKDVAFFDWDKTIRKGGYVIFDFIKVLVEKNIIDKNIEVEIANILKEHSGGKLSYNDFAERAVRIYGKYINGVPVEAIRPALDEFDRRESENNRIYPVIENKIFPFLIANGVEPIIISGSQQEAIELYKNRLGFDRVYGIKFRKQNGIYTDDCIVNTAVGYGKTIVVDEFQKREPDSRVVFGFGDSVADIPLIEVAKQGFINNSKKFYKGDNVHYSDFDSEESGDRMIEMMTQTLENLRKRENFLETRD